MMKEQWAASIDRRPERTSRTYTYYVSMLSTTLSTRSFFFFFSSRRRHTRCSRDWSSDVCSSDLLLIRRRELAKLLDTRGDDLQSKINVGLRSVAAKAEAQAGTRFFGRQSDGREDVRRLDGARGTSRARRAGQALQVKRDEQRFAFDAGKNKIGGVWSAHSAGTIDARIDRKSVVEGKRVDLGGRR